MQLLYESDNFVVVWDDGGDLGDTFEIVDKRGEAEQVFLVGDVSKLFQDQIAAWQLFTPYQREVETCLESFTQLGRVPLFLH